MGQDQDSQAHRKDKEKEGLVLELQLGRKMDEVEGEETVNLFNRECLNIRLVHKACSCSLKCLKLYLYSDFQRWPWYV